MPSDPSSKKLMPRGTCPYCDFEQYLTYPNVQPMDDIYFIHKLEDLVINDSFSEVVTENTCQNCQKTFHFIHNISESIYNRKHLKNRNSPSEKKE